MSDDRADRIALALELAESAGAVSRHYFEDGTLAVQTKRDGTPVTVADREIEQTMRDTVAAHHPRDRFIGEEFPDDEGDSGFTWIVDPIDGTKSFVRGVPLYANLIALQEGDDIVFGIINLPSAGIVVHAERGKGCFRNGMPARVSDRATLDGAYVMATWLEDWEPEVVEDLHTQGATVRTWGDAFGYAMVACGFADAVVDYTTQPYDLAPMPVIIEEAGGRFTSLDGRRVFNSGNGIASNGRIHETLRAYVSAPLAAHRNQRGVRL
ncbi:histidinol phosphate phosphatase [Mycobacterium yunnanensis]|uniref:Histidinol phosphate phosphatase n=1 Tax=Mycobacterium yunnanensis TaxID=368477 RepID=A0A9X2YYU9_9MYCO|nr:inositol monophosphatase family protein [Mycobacterium yunnanensis]MCV7421015.1 histidinol phosphate phosphatase [Mycobacterium yunnanensis]